MAYRNLDEFLARLEQAGEVDSQSLDCLAPDDEFPAAQPDKVQIFEDAAHDIRIVRNLFGTAKRIEMALRVDSLDEIAAKLNALLELGRPGAFGAMMTQGMALFSALRTTTNRRAPQQYKQQTFANWRDGLPLSLISSRYPFLHATLLTESAMRPANLTFEQGELLFSGTQQMIEGEAVALAIGGDPAFMLAGAAPLPDLIHRSYLASWLRGRSLETMRVPPLEFEVPSNVDVLLIGTVASVQPDDAGYLELGSTRCKMSVSAVWTRANAVYPLWSSRDTDTLHGALGVMFRPLIGKLLPQGVRIEDYMMYIDRLWLE